MVNICTVIDIDIDGTRFPANGFEQGRHCRWHRHRHLSPRAVCVFLWVWVCLYNVPETQHSYRPQANTQRTQTPKSAESANLKRERGVTKRKRETHPHTHRHTPTHTHTQLFCSLWLSLFHHTSCRALRRLSTRAVFLVCPNRCILFGAVLLCCLLRRTVVNAYEGLAFRLLPLALALDYG